MKKHLLLLLTLGLFAVSKSSNTFAFTTYIDTTPVANKHHIFAPSKKPGLSGMIKLFKNFEKVDYTKYTHYLNYFENLFKINSKNPVVTNHDQLTFLVYDKYNDFQYYLGLQSERFVKPATGAGTPKTIQNQVRIYPAIDPDNKFYLLFMAEQQDLTTNPTPPPLTETGIFYRSKENIFDMVPKNEMANAIVDIHKFQTIWNGMNDQANPNYVFDAVRSFSYSIEDYNQLLGNTEYYWDWTAYKTDASPKKMINIMPVLVDDDVPNHVSLKLVWIPYKRNLLGQFVIDNSRYFFDHMDVCPEKCPSNEL